MLSTTHDKPISNAKRTSFHFPILDKYFRREEQQKLIQQDLDAGHHVAWMLVGVIAAGSSLGMAAVVAMLLLR